MNPAAKTTCQESLGDIKPSLALACHGFFVLVEA
jgi:hypothetical protein